MIREIESPPPNLFESRAPKLGSKGWIPRNRAARVGALIIGTVYLVAGLVAIITTPLLSIELRRMIPSPAIGIVVSVVVIAIVLTVFSGVIFVGGRIVICAFRKTPHSLG